MFYIILIEHVAGAIVCSVMLREHIRGCTNHVILMIFWPPIMIAAIVWADVMDLKRQTPPE